MEYINICIRTSLFYFFILLIYRIMGKREVGQLGIIDLIVSILIAELAVLSIEELDKSIFISIVPILTLTLLQTILAYFSLKKPKFRILLDGNPSLIIKNGKVNFKEMTKQKYNLDDLLVQLREKGFKSIEEIEYAILENNGTLSVFAYEEEKDNYLPLPLILDNKIQEDTLKHLHKDSKWVLNLLDKRNINIEDVFYAFYKDKNVFIIKNDDLI
ncbi:MAG: DUF421 domain-containing protein [Bacilli bacterium]|nr:DUF421 domain-containing protein [Bacilli bacterium]